MGKFRIRVKLQGFELEVDGDREDIPAITTAVQHQLGGLVSPPELDPEPPPSTPQTVIDMTNSAGKRSSRRKSVNARSAASSSPGAIEFRHDSAKYGSPKQNWTVTQKCIWLLYVLEGLTATKEVSAAQLTATYNSQFKAAGKLHPPHVPRELTSAKVAVPAPVGEDKGLWFLTDEGKTQAEELVKQGLGQ